MRKGAEIEQFHRQSRLQSRSLLSVFTKAVSRGQVSLGCYPSDIRGSVYFTADFQALEKHELDRRNSTKITKKKEKESESERDRYKSNCWVGPRIIGRKTQLACRCETLLVVGKFKPERLHRNRTEKRRPWPSNLSTALL